MIKTLNDRRILVIVGIIVVLAAIAWYFLSADTVQGRQRSYYHGDAINFNDRIVFGTTNQGAAEIFTLENGRIVRHAAFRSFHAVYSKVDNYYDLCWSEEAGRLYLYLVDGRRIYKYDATDLNDLRLLKEVKDNSWDWFMSVGRYGDRIVTTGPKGAKVFDKELTVIDNHPVNTLGQGNTALTTDQKFLVALEDGLLTIWNARFHGIAATAEITANTKAARAPYIDNLEGAIYVVDDESLKRYDLDGRVTDLFYHISDIGYAAAGFAGSRYVYFSDGIGVVKMDKSTFEPVDWSYTTELARPEGWAMGLNVVPGAGGETVIVYNNSSIIAFDQNLDLIDDYEATGEEYGPMETLSLRTDIPSAPSGTYIRLTGTGWGEAEELAVYFNGQRTFARADSGGRIDLDLLVPEKQTDKPLYTDIKVDGRKTKLTYSVSFTIVNY